MPPSHWHESLSDRDRHVTVHTTRMPVSPSTPTVRLGVRLGAPGPQSTSESLNLKHAGFLNSDPGGPVPVMD
jgi:hypothetical protein